MTQKYHIHGLSLCYYLWWHHKLTPLKLKSVNYILLYCMIVQDLVLRDCHMVIFTANLLLQLLPNWKFSIHNKVPENAPETVSDSLKSGGACMPQDPPVYMSLCTSTQSFAPPLFHKYSFRPHPPLGSISKWRPARVSPLHWEITGETANIQYEPVTSLVSNNNALAYYSHVAKFKNCMQLSNIHELYGCSCNLCDKFRYSLNL